MSDEDKSLTVVNSQLSGMEKKIQELFKKKTPKAVIKFRKGAGNKMYPYVPIDYTLSELDKNFGIFWEFVTDEVRRTELQIIVRGKLVIKSPTGFSISRPGVGRANIKKYSGTTKSVDEGNDEKAATSDAIKKAASLFGVAADVYYKELEKYEDLGDELNEEVEIKQKAMSRFFAVAAERGFTGENAKERIKEACNVKHMDDLSVQQIRGTIAHLEKYYEVVEPGEEPRKFGEAPLRRPEDQGTGKPVASNEKPEVKIEPVKNEEEKDATFRCHGLKHKDQKEEDIPITSINDPWCSDECRDSYYPKKKDPSSHNFQFTKRGKKDDTSGEAS